MDIHISLNGASIKLTPEQLASLDKFVQVMLFGSATRKSSKKPLGSRRWTRAEIKKAKALKAEHNGRVPMRAIEALAQKISRTPIAVYDRVHKV